MAVCKRCDSMEYVRNGFVQGKQRYRCKSCGYNYSEGDKRVNGSLPAKKALAVLLYSLGKGSFTMLGKIFGHSPSLIYRWIIVLNFNFMHLEKTSK
jgi:transposase